MPDNSNWYRGNLHMHSFWSDGHGFPEMIAERFREAGYHFIAFTEHDRLQQGDHWIKVDPQSVQGRYLLDGGLLKTYLNRHGESWVEQRQSDDMPEVRIKPLDEYRGLVEEAGRFVIFDGEEVTTRWEGGTHYINVINHTNTIGRQKDVTSQAAVKRTLDAATAAGADVIASFNHPNYAWNASAQQLADMESLEFVEIYTALRICKTYGDDEHLAADRLWDQTMAKRGRIIFGQAADDCHRYVRGIDKGDEGAQPCRAWIMVRAHELTSSAIVGAMRRGDFYSTSGITLNDVSVSDNTLRVAVDESVPGCRIQFIATKCDGSQVGEVRSEVDGWEGACPIGDDDLYVRAEVISDQPHPDPTIPDETIRAWTQPYGRGE